MRPIILLFILLSLPIYFMFSSESSDSVSTENPKQYCNTRFDFCLKYPDQLFTKSLAADNGDGIRLSSEDGKLYVEASGSFNVLDWTLTDIHNFYYDGLKGKYPDVETISFQISAIRSESVFRYGKELRYYETVLQNDHYATLVIAVPQGMEEMLISLKKEITLAVQI